MHTAHGLVISESTIHQASSPNLTTPPHTYTDLFAYNQLSCVFLRQTRSDTKSLLSSIFPSTSFDTTDRVISDQIQNTTHDELFLDTYTKYSPLLWRRLTFFSSALIFSLSSIESRVHSVSLLKKRYQASSGFFLARPIGGRLIFLFICGGIKQVSKRASEQI